MSATDATLAAPTPLVPAPEGFRARLLALPMRAVALLAIGTLGLIAVALVLALRTSSPSGSDYKVLFAGLSDKDGGAVLQQLTQMNVPYKHAEGGGAILVPSDRVHDVRMRLGQLGLPKSPINGYEMLDAPKLGQTQAGEQVAFKRAMEGELMRTIGSLSAVQSARVMLALPATNGFFREQQKPSASVVVSLHPGRTLDRAQLAGIVHLVSSSVPELSPKAVSVVDGDGSLLTQSEKPEGSVGLDAQQLAYVQQVEGQLQQRVLELLEPVVGRENLRATVTADLDFSEQVQVSEEFKPNQGPDAKPAIRAVQTLENNQPGANPPSGVPGAVSNTPPVPASAPLTGPAQPLGPATGNGALAGNALRRENTTQYEVDKTQRTVRSATGTLRRLSAAVIVNHKTETDAKGKSTTKPLSEDELGKLTALVQQAVGYVEERGDSVKVVNAPFRVPAAPKVEETPIWQQPWVQDMARAWATPLALALVALLIVFTMIRPALKQLFAKPEPVAVQQIDAVVDDPTALPGEELALDPQSLMLEAPKVNKKVEEARALAKDNPAAMANIVRNFINNGQEA